MEKGVRGPGVRGWGWGLGSRACLRHGVSPGLCICSNSEQHSTTSVQINR